MHVARWGSCAVWNPVPAWKQGSTRSLLSFGGQGGQLSIARLGDPPQRRQSSVSLPSFRSWLLSGVEVGGHGGWGEGGAVDGDVGEAAGEEVAAALQYPGP